MSSFRKRVSIERKDRLKRLIDQVHSSKAPEEKGKFTAQFSEGKSLQYRGGNFEAQGRKHNPRRVREIQVQKQRKRGKREGHNAFGVVLHEKETTKKKKLMKKQRREQ